VVDPACGTTVGQDRAAQPGAREGPLVEASRGGVWVAEIPYRFDRFQRQLLYHDLRFEGGPEPGERFHDFELPTIDGRRLTRDGSASRRPMLVIFSSFT
jgi:hypothetical protein